MSDDPNIVAECAVCGRGLRVGDRMCAHSILEIARYERDGCACGGDHVGEVVIEAAEVASAYQHGYDDGVEQERASIAKEIGRLNDRERLKWVEGYVHAYHLTREPAIPHANGDVS